MYIWDEFEIRMSELVEYLNFDKTGIKPDSQDFPNPLILFLRV